MPTLLQINVTANQGSTGKIAEDIGQMALLQGWKSYIAYGRGVPKSASNLIRIGSDWDMWMHAIETRIFDNHGLASRRVTRELLKKVEQIKPDLIHLHNIHGYYINYKILLDYLSKSKIPVVWTLHDCWTMTGHCCHFEYIGCNKWQTHCADCGIMKDYPKSWFRDNSYHNYDSKREAFCSLNNLTIVPVCGWLDNIVSKSYLSGYRRKIIENGIDLSIFCPHHNDKNLKNELGLKGKYMLLGVASVWSDLKGLNDIIYFRQQLSSEYDIVLVGMNDAQLKQIQHSGIIGIKKTENTQQLADLYSAADVFINPTYSDTFPTVNIEAIACGTPVVSYDTGGCSDIITQDTGVIVPRGDRERFWDSITRIATEGKERYSSACRTRAVTHFDKQKCFKAYLELYQAILGE